MMQRILLLSLVALLASAQDRRISPNERGRRLALVIGNNDYPWKPLRNAVNDAQAVARLLPQLGFAAGDITLVTNTRLKDLQRATRSFIEKLRSDDVAFVYYSGHGVEVRGENFLVPVDFPANATELEARDEAYSAQQLLKSIEETNARVRLIVLDACRDNPLRSSRSGSGGLAKMDGKGTLIIFATGAGQTADDNRGGSNGLFTSHLLRALPTPGVPVDQLVKQVARDVHNARPEQTPAVYGLLYEDFTFVPARESASTNTCAEGWAMVKAERNVALLEQYLAGAANCPEATLARLAIAKLKAPATPGNSITAPSGTLAEGKKAYDAKDYPKARPILQGLAEKGDALAQMYVGYMNEFGLGASANKAEAARWYRESANRGNRDAQYNLALLYTKGEGVAKDETQAVQWFTKAAEKGDTDAQLSLGYRLENGIGVDKNYVEAVKWYRKAADGGLPAAQYNLGLCYEFGKGVDKDISQALRYYDQAAAKNDPEAKKRAADLRAKPILTPPIESFDDGKKAYDAKDYPKARRILQAVATNGNALAQMYVGYMNEFGLGAPANKAEAARWYRLSANQNNRDAQYNLALLYTKGEGVAKDESQAVQWFTKAAEKGDVDAQLSLGYRLENGIGTEKNIVEAAKWYRKAADGGLPAAQYNLGLCYEFGKGMDKDIPQALRLYDQAAAKGDAAAKTRAAGLRGQSQGAKKK